MVLAALLDAVAEVRTGDEVAVGVGLRRADDAWWRGVSPLNIPAWRDFPLRGPAHDRPGLPVHRQRRQGARARRGVGGAARGVARLHCDGRVDRRRRRDRARRSPPRRRERQRRSHRSRHRGARRAACACGGHGCLEAEASGTAIAARTGAARRGRAGRGASATGSVVGRAVASVADLARPAPGGGGGFGGAWVRRRLLHRRPGELDRRARISFARGATIRRAGLGHEGPLIGAAAVAWQGLGHPLLGSVG